MARLTDEQSTSKIINGKSSDSAQVVKYLKEFMLNAKKEIEKIEKDVEDLEK